MSGPILIEELEGGYSVRLIFQPRARNRFKVEEHHPCSGWVHSYHCGSLRKAIEYIDVTLRDRIHRGIATSGLRKRPDVGFYPYTDENCPNHVASPGDRKVCAMCGIHVDELRPPEEHL